MCSSVIVQSPQPTYTAVFTTAILYTIDIWTYQYTGNESANVGGSGDERSDIGDVVKLGSVDNNNVGGGESGVQLTSVEWSALVKAMSNIATCPFVLRTLYILLVSEQLVLLPPTHPYKCVVQVTSGLYNITTQIHTTTTVEYTSAANDDTNSHTSNTTSIGTHYTHTSHRNPFSRFFKNCSKSLQHKFTHTDIVSQTELTNHLSSNNTNNNHYHHNNPNTNIFSSNSNIEESEHEPSVTLKSARGDYINTSASSVHTNSSANNGTNFPNQHHNAASNHSNASNNNTNPNAAPSTNAPYRRPAGGTIAKPNTSNAGTIGIRIVGVAGEHAMLLCSFVICLSSIICADHIYVE